ncbi:MAG: hypothetical protein R6X13_05605 [bacterium]
MRVVAAGLLVALLAGTGCDEASFSQVVVTAQVVKTLGPESNTASVLLGKATVVNIFRDDWMETPDPGDTTFWDYVFPARVTPMGGADVRLNNSGLAERVSGVYFEAALPLEYLRRYDLAITTADGKLISGHACLPDSFSVIEPAPGDSGGFAPLRVTWTRADSAESYIVGVTPLDSGSTAAGWSAATADTTYLVPAEAFADSLGVFQPGEYGASVTAVNGGWNKSGLDLFLSGGNVSGAVGTFGCAVHAWPVLVRRY